jgi:homopolymeric O-antigen transport system ATP-binding protein
MAKPDLKPITPGTNGHDRAPLPPANGQEDEAVSTPAAREGGVLHPDARREAAPQERLKVIKFSHVSKRFQLHAARPKSFQDLLVGLMGRTRRRPPEELAPTKEFWALKDVNFSIYQGEAVGIIGENGSGKSTTLKLISRILYPTTGSVNVVGKVSALLELGTGFHPDLTGRENIFLNGSLLGMSRKAMEGLYDQIVDFAELGQFIEQPIKWYSSGMVMRLGFAVAINVNPDILITDEVLAVGDEAFQRKCLEAIAQIRRSGKTIIFVSHALEAVRGLCQRVIWLDHGEVRADGQAGAVIDQYLDFANRRHRDRLEAEFAAPDATPATAPPTEGEPGAAGERPASRWGSGEVRITDAQFLDGNGVPAKVFQTGDPLTIRLYYHAPGRVWYPVFGIALYTGNGVHVLGPNTRFADYEIPFIEGEGYVDYTIPELPLMAGVYDLTVAATNSDMTVMYDHQHNWYHFVVQPNPDLPDRFGLVYVPGTWHAH